MPAHSTQGAAPPRSYPSRSHSSGSGSSSPTLPSRTTAVDDVGEGVATSDDGDRIYYLEVVQSPERTAEFGNAALSRLPLAPALIVQLTVRDRSGDVVQIHGELPFLVAHLALLAENGSQVAEPSPSNDQIVISPSQRSLYGSLVSSPHFLQNQQGHPGIYFIFPDIARPDSNHVINEGSGTTLVSTRTRVFEVVPQADYDQPDSMFSPSRR
ncbi:velvet factor, partial [Rhizoctonia solani AG-3 Rhs1AP]